MAPSHIRRVLSDEWGTKITRGMVAGFLQRMLGPKLPPKPKQLKQPKPKSPITASNGGGGKVVRKPAKPPEALLPLQLPASPVSFRPAPLSVKLGVLPELLIDNGKVVDVSTGKALGRVVRECPGTVHPAFDVEGNVWFLDEPKVQAPSLRVLQAMLPAGTVITGYRPLPSPLPFKKSA